MDLANHPYFEAWTDPVSGIVSYVLTERVAPLQKNFYFVNTGLDRQESVCWFEAAFPPSPQKVLGVVGLDPDRPFISVFPATAFDAASPLVSDDGRTVWYAQGPDLLEFPIDGEPRAVCTLSPDYIQNRRLYRLATHLTRTPDGERFLVDGWVGNQWFVGLASPATGAIDVIRELPRQYNHAQFHPSEADLFSIAQDHWRDPVTGRYTGYDHRIWLMSTDGSRFEPLHPSGPMPNGDQVCHEWWSDDGWMCWTRYRQGAFECDVRAGRTNHVWKRPLCHIHCDATRRYWVADQSPYQWPKQLCEVLFYDRQAERDVPIVAAMPAPRWERKAYHIDPHPRFTPSGRWINYTTTVRGTVDLALTPVQSCLDALK